MTSRLTMLMAMALLTAICLPGCGGDSSRAVGGTEDRRPPIQKKNDDIMRKSAQAARKGGR
jgi:hypothetical protein